MQIDSQLILALLDQYGIQSAPIEAMSSLDQKSYLSELNFILHLFPTDRLAERLNFLRKCSQAYAMQDRRQRDQALERFRIEMAHVK